jgi:hypothetical protein
MPFTKVTDNLLESGVGTSANNLLKLDSSGDVSLGDNKKIVLGASDDLQIYHDGSMSVVKDAGTGQLRLDSDGLGVWITSADGAEAMAKFRKEGAVELFHDDFQKLATTSTGIDVTGKIQADANILSAIDASITGNAVDIFVYDTSKDSDGGAWRKRTQGTSWYNETLNTSTRGSRKEFPAVAVIVAESTKVTIYDGDDPDLPMWMVLNFVSYGMVSSSMNGVTAVNGMFSLGGGANAISFVDFLKDRGTYLTYTLWNNVLGSIADRHVAKSGFGSQYSTQRLVNSIVNDVAMTVLPNAPIDTATGLPTPTIAVATDGGVSVIKDDGSVVDITNSGGAYDESPLVMFTEDGRIRFVMDSTARRYFRTLAIPSADYVVDRWAPAADNGGISITVSASYGDSSANTVGSSILYATPKAIGTTSSNGGITHYKENLNDYIKSSVAYTTSKYNTGYMVGDIKGAWNVDTDVTSLSGTELVTNGDFSSSTGWNNVNSTGGWSIAGGVATRSTALNTSIWTTLTGLVVGKSYVMSVDINTYGGSSLYFYINNAQGAQISSTGTHSATFVATATSNVFGITALSSSGTVLDNISVREAVPDRSVKGNGLAVHGTPTVSAVATGAELKGIHFSGSSNYLKRVNDSDLNVGTGDFSFSGWVKRDGAQSGYILDFSTASGSNRLHVLINSNGLWYTNLGSDAGTLSFSTGVWQHFTVTRISGVLYQYVDGEFDLSGNYSTDLTGCYINVGTRYTVSGGLIGSVALIRFSATGLTAEQVKEISEAERPMFQENAKCTLNGSSDAVTALAYDDSTELLHVGTSGGRSTFQGLRRVDETSTSTTEIAASGGLIVEET